MSNRVQQVAPRWARLLQSRSHITRPCDSSHLFATQIRQSSPQWQRRNLHQGAPARQSVPPAPASRVPGAEAAKSAQTAPVSDLSKGFADTPLPTADPSAPSLDADATQPVDWTRSYHGLSATPFSAEAAEILQAPLDPEDVEIKPDGILYLPEIKYRRILNRAFGPGGWGLAPRGETIVTPKAVTREYALVVLGRLVSIARGEQDYFSPDGIPTAAEGCRSNALLRCCKDLGIASELWDPRFIRDFMKKNVKEVWAENVSTKRKKKLYIRKDGAVAYPWKETKA